MSELFVVVVVVWRGGVSGEEGGDWQRYWGEYDLCFKLRVD